MEKLKLNELLRYAFSGGVALLTLVFIYPSAFCFFKSNDKVVDITLLSVLALIVGSLIYSLHRAVIYPIFYRIILIILCTPLFKKYKFEGKMLIPWIPTRLELRLDIERWQRRRKEKSLQAELTEWGSQIHFLYTTSWAIFVAIIIGKYLPEETVMNINNIAYQIILGANCLILLPSTIITHFRSQLYTEEVAKKEKEIVDKD